MSKYINHWLHYPYLSDSNMDHLLHPDDQPLLKGSGLGIVKCAALTEDDYLVLEFKGLKIRGKVEGAKKILPAPLFVWGEGIAIAESPDRILTIADFFWHFKDECYYYILNENGRMIKKRYKAEELFKA